MLYIRLYIINKFWCCPDAARAHCHWHSAQRSPHSGVRAPNDDRSAIRLRRYALLKGYIDTPACALSLYPVSLSAQIFRSVSRRVCIL